MAVDKKTGGSIRFTGCQKGHPLSRTDAAAARYSIGSITGVSYRHGLFDLPGQQYKMSDPHGENGDGNP